MALSSSLLRAYRNTSYVVRVQGEPRLPAFVLRVGVGHPAFQPTAPWVMVGAYTGSTAHTSVNKAAHRRLGEALRKEAKALWEGQGFGEDGTKVEERMWLAEGISFERAIALGKAYRQKAVLVGVPGGTPRLVLSATGEDVSGDVPRPELPAAALADVRRRVQLIAAAMKRAEFAVTAARVGLGARGRRRWHAEALPDRAWGLCGVLNGLEFAWRADGVAGACHFATAAEMEAEVGRRDETNPTFDWASTRDAHLTFSGGELDGPLMLCSAGDDCVLAENLEPLEVINCYLDRLALSGWELALMQFGNGAVEDAGKKLRTCEALARQTWQRMGLPLPPSLVPTRTSP
ncbi:MAG: DUF3293 domain-containing protein [Deltaproteobacteria bacterium]|nr:DUF3293 domain-containing protein [Deltaproteobacteria bacterium]